MADKTVLEEFDVFHQVANEYFNYHFFFKRSCTHTIFKESFVIWIYYNIQDDIDVNKEVNVLKRLAYNYKLDEHGWLIEKPEK